MIRVLSLAAAALTSAALLGATGARAETAPRFVATPVAAASDARLVTRDTLWRLQGNSYVAANSRTSDMIGCQLVARDAGRLSSFVADGVAFDAAQLDKCNAKAKAVPMTIANAN